MGHEVKNKDRRIRLLDEYTIRGSDVTKGPADPAVRAPAGNH